MTQARLSYEESCAKLWGRFLDPGEVPPLPDHMPGPDDPGPLGVSFFRTMVGDGEDLADLTLPRTFFHRSEISDVSFRNTDLTESNLCWNDFIDVDFSEAVLAYADMRASVFEGVDFTGADLRGADMRRSEFTDCSFRDAQLEEAVLTHEQGETMELDDDQREAVAWTDDPGPEPDE